VSVHTAIPILIVSSAFCCWIQSIVITGARRSRRQESDSRSGRYARHFNYQGMAELVRRHHFYRHKSAPLPSKIVEC
jgi:hypothetical protein